MGTFDSGRGSPFIRLFDFLDGRARFSRSAAALVAAAEVSAFDPDTRALMARGFLGYGNRGSIHHGTNRTQ